MSNTHKNFLQLKKEEESKIAKKTFINYGKTFSELLKNRGYRPTYGKKWVPPGYEIDDYEAWIDEETALIHIFNNWNTNG